MSSIEPVDPDSIEPRKVIAAAIIDKLGKEIEEDSSLSSVLESWEIERQFEEKTRFDNYGLFVGETAIFPDDRGISYCVTKLCGEIGEVHDKVSDIVRKRFAFTDDFFNAGLTDEERDPILLELGDVLWYTTALCRQIGRSLYDVYLLEPDPDPLMESTSDVSFILSLSRMSAHAGAIAERSGKMIRDKGSDGTNTSYLSDPDYVKAIELHLHHLIELIEFSANGLDWCRLSEVMSRNVEKLESRRRRNVLKGDGDNR